MGKKNLEKIIVKIEKDIKNLCREELIKEFDSLIHSPEVLEPLSLQNIKFNLIRGKLYEMDLHETPKEPFKSKVNRNR